MSLNAQYNIKPYKIIVKNNGKKTKLTLAKEKDADLFIKNKIKANVFSATNPKGIAIKTETILKTPDKKVKSIAKGIRGKTKIFVGMETIDRMPVE